MNSVRKIDFQAIDRYLNGYAYLLLSTIFVALVLSVDRIDLFDNDNYINYFSNQDPFTDFFQQVSDAGSLVKAAGLFFSEEPIWLLYTQIISSILSPTLSVYFTVLLLNGVIVYSCSKFEYGFSGLLLWVLLPMGAAIMGLYQIRQGLAFSLLALFFARRWNLTVGTLIAAMVHTTFAVPLMIFLFLSLKKIRSKQPVLYLLVFAIFSYFLCQFLAMSFDEFAGRRTKDYQVTGFIDVNYNFILSVFLTSLPSIVVALDRQIQADSNTAYICLMHIGIFIWIVSCFFVFPIGLARIDYFSATFSMFPILAAGRDICMKHPLATAAYAFGILVLIYGGVREGSYEQLF